MIKRTLVVLGACLVLTVAGCGTLSGFGRDIEAIGGGVSGGAAR